MRRLIFLLSLFVTGLLLNAQITKEDYQRADAVSKFRDLVLNDVLELNWIDSSSVFWYKTRVAPDTVRFYIVDAQKQEKRPAFNHERLALALREALKTNGRANRLTLEQLKLSADIKSFTFEHKDSVWKCHMEDDYRLEALKPVEKRRNGGHWGKTRDELGNDPVASPDEKKEAFIRDYNLFVRYLDSDKVVQLSFDGAAGDLYSSYVSWSPDSRYLTTNQVRLHEKRYMQFVESSPEGQLLPKLHKIEYLRAGDALPIHRPTLFDVDQEKQMEIDTRPFENQYALSNVRWSPDSQAFTFEFNQRGHQRYQVVRVDVASGNTKILIDEQSDTFIDYSGKRYRYDVKDTGEIIWASERDGWNHLYLFDGESGQLKNPITTGRWVVRGVEQVNTEERFIIFRGSGRNSNEDPYFEHYYRVGFDGKGLTELTPEEGQHRARFSHNQQFFVDTYSSPDVAPVGVLRRTSDGQLLMTLEEADLSHLIVKGWRAPEPFVAKGRDGKTDIWGNIYRPTNFDPEKSYPVIEYIYAGPHSSFVQKSFTPYMAPFSSLAELGFIIVQIDGMGTSNRSKAFHDVCYKNLKDAGFPDRILWIKAAAEKYAYMDTTRVGIFGASAGGQSAMGALLFHPDFYTSAVASCGCHDNRMDKIWWNEQWMGYPVGPHYAESSNVDNAHLLEGQLMLIVGENDDNVDPASTMQVADALIEADKDFELLVLPGVNHTLGGKYGERRRRDFFVQTLLQKVTPEWNK
ncbi:S9 family peptidase [Geofilum rubicundum]|uniref:Dipeptidyl peptidase IV n=1 Tax=Geofilum rubicundum JCM 15548 TaxID=1236989 RepID=A0A0E9M463_9BACT|nr:S9 family peptidase [Geofilum rubicundum]GAO31965.1 dipeptidyl peptidase IV [Geofilum rubicundum JCM 15548]